MKKLLAIILLVLMPLQFSMAAVSSYCEHEANSSESHPGHHSHQHENENNETVASDSDAKKTSSSSGVHHDCASCHMGCLAFVINNISSIISKSDQTISFGYLKNSSRVNFERPERPQWLLLA